MNVSALETVVVRVKLSITRALTRAAPACGRQAGSSVSVLLIMVNVTMRQTESAIASDAATAWVNREEATGAGLSANPGPAPRDRIMVVNPSSGGRITREMEFAQCRGRDFGGTRAKIGQIMASGTVMPAVHPGSRRKWMATCGQASALVSAGLGRQSIVTKPGACSTRRSHARMAGNVARSKSH